MCSDYFGELAEDIKPIVLPGSSDSAALDNVFEVLVRAGRIAPMAKTDAGAGGLVEARDQDAAGLAGHVRLLERGDGALGRAGGAGHDRRALGLRRARPQRPAADALRRHRRRAGDRRLGGRHGADRRHDGGREGRARAGAAARGRHGRGQALPRRRDQGPAGRGAAVRRVGRLDHRPRGADATASRSGRSSRAPSCGGGRSRRATRSRSWRPSWHAMAEDGKEAIGSMGDDTPPAVLSRPLPAAQPLLPAELQPGDQPADRQLARAPGDEPEDPVRQPEERARPGQLADRDPAAREPVRVERALRGDGAAVRRPRRSRSTAPSRPARPDALQAGLARIRAEAEEAVRAGREPHRPDRRRAGAGAGGDADDPRDERGAFLADPQGPADLHLAQRALGASASTRTISRC